MKVLWLSIKVSKYLYYSKKKLKIQKYSRIAGIRFVFTTRLNNYFYYKKI
jgi:hypothetical protein